MCNYFFLLEVISCFSSSCVMCCLYDGFGSRTLSLSVHIMLYCLVIVTENGAFRSECCFMASGIKLWKALRTCPCFCLSTLELIIQDSRMQSWFIGMNDLSVQAEHQRLLLHMKLNQWQTDCTQIIRMGVEIRNWGVFFFPTTKFRF